jgi:hypothetical protein
MDHPERAQLTEESFGADLWELGTRKFHSDSDVLIGPASKPGVRHVWSSYLDLRRPAEVLVEVDSARSVSQ